jgi:HEAT repeat protein
LRSPEDQDVAQGRGRKWVRRAAAGLVLLVAAAGAWATLNYDALKARYAAHRMKTAATDEDRAKWADQLAAQGEAGLPKLLEMLRSNDPAWVAAAAGALDRHLDGLPDGDPRAAALCGQILDAFPTCSEHGRRAVLGLIPGMLKRSGAIDPVKCRAVIAAGLAMPGVEDRLLAIRLAMHPTVKMRADLVSLLQAPEPQVRRAALFAVGPATDAEPVIGDEELFHWLHDPDEGVRKVCYDALVSRGRTEPEIALGRRLTHPDPAERLKLLMDLRYDDDVSDPEPWLERLSRDPDPAVRAGAARVAVEVAADRQQPAPVWVGRLADGDPYVTVRRVAGYFRAQPTTKSAAGPVQPAGGP